MSVWGITELFVGNLPPETTDEEISTLFKGYGGVVEGWVAKKGKKAATAGPAAASFGVVRMASHAEALVAKKSLNLHTYKGKVITVRWAENQRALWVGNLAPHVTNEILDSAFSQFGAVVSAVVVADSVKNASARFGFVVFDEKKDAHRALAQCTEQMFLVGGSMVPVRVALARSEDAETGYSQDAQAAKRARHSHDSGSSHFAMPGGQEFSMAMRMRQLQLEYEAAKNKLKAQRAEMEAAALMGGDTMPSMSPGLAPPQLGGGLQGLAGGLQMQGMQMQGRGGGNQGAGGGGGMMHQMGPMHQMPPMQMPQMQMAAPRESYHHVPPPRQIRTEKTYERFNPRPHDPSAGPPASSAPMSYPPPAAAAPPPQPAAGGGLKFVAAGSLSTVKDQAAAAAAAAVASAAAAPAQPAGQLAQQPGDAVAAAPAGTATDGTADNLLGAAPGAKAPGSHDHKGLGFSGPDPTPAPPTGAPAPPTAPPPDMRQPYQPPGPSFGGSPQLPKYEPQLPQRYGEGPRLGWSSGGAGGGLPGVVLQPPSYNGQAPGGPGMGGGGPTSMPMVGYGSGGPQGSYPPPMMPPNGPPHGGAYQAPPPIQQQPPNMGNMQPPNGMGAPPPGNQYGPPPVGMGGPQGPPYGGDMHAPPPGQQMMGGGGGFPPMGPGGPQGWPQGPPGGPPMGGPGGPMQGQMGPPQGMAPPPSYF